MSGSLKIEGDWDLKKGVDENECEDEPHLKPTKNKQEKDAQDQPEQKKKAKGEPQPQPNKKSKKNKKKKKVVVPAADGQAESHTATSSSGSAVRRLRPEASAQLIIMHNTEGKPMRPVRQRRVKSESIPVTGMATGSITRLAQTWSNLRLIQRAPRRSRGGIRTLHSQALFSQKRKQSVVDKAFGQLHACAGVKPS